MCLQETGFFCIRTTYQAKMWFARIWTWLLIMGVWEQSLVCIVNSWLNTWTLQVGCGTHESHQKPMQKHAFITWQLGIRAENPFTRGSHGWRAKMLGCIEIQSQNYSKTKSAASQMSIRCWYLLVHCTASTNPHEARMDHHGCIHFASPGASRWPCRHCSTSRASWWLFSSAFALAPI